MEGVAATSSMIPFTSLEQGMTWKLPIAIDRHVSIGFIEPYDEDMRSEADPECELLAAL
jgi:hypothetical protein